MINSGITLSKEMNSITISKKSSLMTESKSGAPSVTWNKIPKKDVPKEKREKKIRKKELEDF
jgi:hypothetical protein